MDNSELIQRVYRVFPQAQDPPPMSLRSGDAVDSYDSPIAFDPVLDQPTDQYLQQFAYHALPHLDSVSWRYYLPYLIDFALRHFTVDAQPQSGLCVEGLVFSLRPPDREPPRLATLTSEQESVVIEFLDCIAFDDCSDYQEEAMQAIEEYWMPGAVYRETPG